LPRAFLYCSAYLLVSLTICYTISLSKKTKKNCTMSLAFYAPYLGPKTQLNTSVSCVIVLILIASATAMSSFHYYYCYHCHCYYHLNFRLNCTQFPALHWLSERILSLLCLHYHTWVSSRKKCTDWKHARRIPAVTEHKLIATPNERLYYFLPICRRNWHTIFVLISSQQQIWSPSRARVQDKKNIPTYRTV
jgi:hypothetical protein